MGPVKYDNISKSINDITFADYYSRLNLMARTVFKWENLPEGIDEKWIEKFLYYEGRCVFFKDKTKGLMVAKCTPNGTLNYYDEYTKVKPYGTGYVGPSLINGEECVIIRNNDDCIPTDTTIQLYAHKLTTISRTVDINVNAQKTPVVILCNNKQLFSFKNLFKQWAGFEPVVFGAKDLDLENFKTIRTEAPIVFPQLETQKHMIWNECMTFLGINNANMDKRERLVDDEVQANNDQVEMSAQIMLKSREKACEDINKMFGTDIRVSVRGKGGDQECMPDIQ